MARRYPAPPKLLLYIFSALISAVTLAYGQTLGWLSIHMIYLYIFFTIYYYAICKGDKAATCYTIAGTVTAMLFLLVLKYEDSLLGVAIGLIIGCIVAFMTDKIVKTDWRYFSLGDFTSFLSSSPIERSIQFKYDQHVPVGDAPPVPESPNREVEVRPQSSKKKIEKPLSRKEKKIAARKEKKEGSKI